MSEEMSDIDEYIAERKTRPPEPAPKEKTLGEKAIDAAIEAAMPANALLNDLGVGYGGLAVIPRLAASGLDAASNVSLFTPAAPAGVGYKAAMMSVKPMSNLAKRASRDIGNAAKKAWNDAGDFISRRALNKKVPEAKEQFNLAKGRIGELEAKKRLSPGEMKELRNLREIIDNHKEMMAAVGDYKRLPMMDSNFPMTKGERIGAASMTFPLRVLGNEYIAEPFIEGFNVKELIPENLREKTIEDFIVPGATGGNFPMPRK